MFQDRIDITASKGRRAGCISYSISAPPPGEGGQWPEISNEAGAEPDKSASTRVYRVGLFRVLE